MAAGDLPAADTRGRPLRDLRISVTDRCQFRCTYCMPREIFGRDFAFLPRQDLLTFEELTRLGRVFAGLGVRKLRLTGGEPLLRRDLERLVAMLAGIDGVEDIALRTDGALLAGKARLLGDAGLRRVTVSLDSLDDAVFMALNDAAFPVAGVLDAIAAAAGAGLPVKVNMVVKRRCNDQSVLLMAEHFRGSGHVLRLIEFMDVGTTNGWRLDDVAAAAEIIALIGGRWPLELLAPSYPGEVAYRYRDGGGEIGVIASVTQPFCRGCTRARLSAEDRYTPACSPGRATTCAAAPATRRSAPRLPRSGRGALTGTPSCARSQYARSRRWRCRTSAASRPRGQERPGRTPVPAGRLEVGAGHDIRDRRAMHRCHGQGRSSLPAARPVPPIGR
jgi:cyclic pyranopterin phosphate synthase